MLDNVTGASSKENSRSTASRSTLTTDLAGKVRDAPERAPAEGFEEGGEAGIGFGRATRAERRQPEADRAGFLADGWSGIANSRSAPLLWAQRLLRNWNLWAEGTHEEGPPWTLAAPIPGRSRTALAAAAGRAGDQL